VGPQQTIEHDVKAGKVQDCDLSNVTNFCKNSDACDPFGLWCLIHPKTPLRGNDGCKGYSQYISTMFITSA